MRNHDAPAHNQCHIERLFLLRPRRSQSVRLNDVIVDAVIAAQSSRNDKSHQLFVLRGNRTFHVCVVINVVKAPDQKIIGLVDIRIQPRPRIQEPPRDLALFGNLLVGVGIGGFFAFDAHG